MAGGYTLAQVASRPTSRGTPGGPSSWSTRSPRAWSRSRRTARASRRTSSPSPRCCSASSAPGCSGRRPRWALVVGALVYHLSFVLDCMDGKIARLKGTGSILGSWLDYVFDRIRVFTCALALFGGQYRETDRRDLPRAGERRRSSSTCSATWTRCRSRRCVALDGPCDRERVRAEAASTPRSGCAGARAPTRTPTVGHWRTPALPRREAVGLRPGRRPSAADDERVPAASAPSGWPRTALTRRPSCRPRSRAASAGYLQVRDALLQPPRPSAPVQRHRVPDVRVHRRAADAR